MPNHYDTLLRVHAPAAGVEDWWAAYRDLFATVAVAAARHTASPDCAWFAVWEGYGFDTGTTLLAFPEPPDQAAHDAVEAERARRREEDGGRNATIRAALRTIPRFDLPHRAYYLLSGPVTAVTDIAEPGRPSDWRRPDLWWPDDRRCFIATDVDFWSLCIGGDAAFVAEVTASVPTRSEVVTLERRLEAEG